YETSTTCLLYRRNVTKLGVSLRERFIHDVPIAHHVAFEFGQDCLRVDATSPISDRVIDCNVGDDDVPDVSAFVGLAVKQGPRRLVDVPKTASSRLRLRASSSQAGERANLPDTTHVSGEALEIILIRREDVVSARSRDHDHGSIDDVAGSGLRA